MSPELELRPATRSDAELLWAWANDPSVRSASFHRGEIPWESHTAWFAGRLARPDCTIYVAELEGVPVAQVRFEGRGEAEVAVSVDPVVSVERSTALVTSAVMAGLPEDWL